MSCPEMPEYITSAGRLHRLSLLRVISFDEAGVPEELLYIPPERMVELGDNDEFMTAYLPVEMTRPVTEETL